jgi:serine/threonine protein kinase
MSPGARSDDMALSAVNSSGKRSLPVDGEEASNGKKARTNAVVGNNQEGVIVFLPRAADPLMLPLPNAVAIPRGKQALLEVEKDQTVHIPGGCELDEYQLTKRDQIASTSLSSVYTAEHSQVPSGVVTVKVLKTRLQNLNAKTHENERNVIRQADMWLREYQSQDDLEHESIVKLYGGDARHLALYMEHVEARDLSARDVWRSRQNDLFIGTRADSRRILRDIASALHYIHDRNLVHNDIKPANILYSPERGAVLCDFGLSSKTINQASMGGTPYYVPPEFIGSKLRGTPSDVWALGITMLYVLRKIPFPDARARPAHPRPLYWMIADLNRATPTSHPRPGVQPMSAVLQMQTWLGEIDDVVRRLDPRDRLERLVGLMLIPNPHQRITMERVLQELYGGEASYNKQVG